MTGKESEKWSNNAKKSGELDVEMDELSTIMSVLSIGYCYNCRDFGATVAECCRLLYNKVIIKSG